MPSKQQLLLDFIPPDDQLYVNRLRSFLRDKEALNTLDQDQENTDNDLYEALQDALEEMNNEYTPITQYVKFSEVPWNILKLGAVLQILTSAGLLSSRNTLTFNDAGGITVQDLDKYGRYINYYNVLVNKYQQSMMRWKAALNVDQAWSNGVYSEYRKLGYW